MRDIEDRIKSLSKWLIEINCFTKLGTHDISLLNITNGEDGSVIEVIKTDGDSHLGGKDVIVEI